MYKSTSNIYIAVSVIPVCPLMALYSSDKKIFKKTKTKTDKQELLYSYIIMYARFWQLKPGAAKIISPKARKTYDWHIQFPFDYHYKNSQIP